MRTKRPVLGVGLIKWPLTCAQLDTPQAVGILTRQQLQVRALSRTVSNFRILLLVVAQRSFIRGRL